LSYNKIFEILNIKIRTLTLEKLVELDENVELSIKFISSISILIGADVAEKNNAYGK
jgi:hypothetical protein